MAVGRTSSAVVTDKGPVASVCPGPGVSPELHGGCCFLLCSGWVSLSLTTCQPHKEGLLGPPGHV